jgi:hypothetical protein
MLDRENHLKRMQDHYSTVQARNRQRAARFVELVQCLDHAKDNLALLPVDQHTSRTRSQILRALRIVALLANE